MQLYALHELESANGKYKTGPVTDAAVALDEWWAYYAGSLEDGTAANGYGPYILVEKHSKTFDTGVTRWEMTAYPASMQSYLQGPKKSNPSCVQRAMISRSTT